MVSQLRQYLTIIFMALLTASDCLNLPEDAQILSNESSNNSKKNDDVRSAIVLIGLNGLDKSINGYGLIPIVEKDIVNLFDANTTLADKIIGDARNFHWKVNSEDSSTNSRLLPLIATPKKALLLFALHETFLKNHKSAVDSKCVVLSKDDLANLLGSEENTPRQVTNHGHQEGNDTQSERSIEVGKI